ncbi:MAG: winged helix-turn-helix transcriptional regulator [Candidatus Aenigmarchaeota archaeon]|nr:winged helix-turn-helix transcriptional regulator [Candidatus Aenigmarchaeota archaeon]
MDFDPTEELILDILNRSNISLTILEIAEKANVHRVTASKYLAVLEARGHVKRRDVGKAKLYSPTENMKPEIPVFKGGKNE